MIPMYGAEYMKNIKQSKSLLNFFLLCFILLNSISSLFAQDALPLSSGEPTLSSSELTSKAWGTQKTDPESAIAFTQQCIDLYKDVADKQQTTLRAYPKNKNEILAVSALNDVGTAYFIQAEIYRAQGKNEEAIKGFKAVMYQYCYAQAWDPRGWYWKVAKASKESILKLNPEEKLPQMVCPEEGKDTENADDECIKAWIPSKVELYDVGKEDFVNYEKYGAFNNVGTKEYRYEVKDQEGLSLAVGEGIYPNTSSIRWDPQFKKANKEKRLACDHWKYEQSPDMEAAFLKWATAPEPPGVKLFYTGLILEKAGLIKHALKCYYAIVVHFPGSVGWTYYHTPWYTGQAALAKINYLLRKNPQLGMKLVDADIKIINGVDNDISNDAVVTNPGKFIKVKPLEKLKPRPSRDLLSIKRRLGKGTVHLNQYENGDWELVVKDKPYIVKGVTYTPTKIGQSPDTGTQTSWMDDDFNQNGIIDGPYESFVDKNKNNRQDKDEPVVGDFKLMKEMGVNTIRLYHQPFVPNKELLREMYDTYGIMVIMGDFFGKYAIGSGAKWDPGTDYTNEDQKKKMLESVAGMVNEYKDEPYILFWLLGNENVYGYACNADKEPAAFYAFANEAAKLVKSLDSNHPVAVGGGDVLFLDKFAANAPEIDIYGTNAYRGNYGFGLLWRQAKEIADRPVVVTEYGCPAYAFGKTLDEAEAMQAAYHEAAWQDIEENRAFGNGAGNAVGGVAFEWLDEWWKAYEAKTHDTRKLWKGPFPDGYMHEEWLGLAAQGEGSKSPFLRQLRQVYFTYKKLWK